jgi:hypothetical protein
MFMAMIIFFFPFSARICKEGKYPNRAKVGFSVYRAPEMDDMHCEKIDMKIFIEFQRIVLVAEYNRDGYE